MFVVDGRLSLIRRWRTFVDDERSCDRTLVRLVPQGFIVKNGTISFSTVYGYARLIAVWHE